ncbi:MAG: hypothetical protein HKN00_03840 [Flavobacteriaceae bacterium]|nr:hypothetical protein [Bacteroidia bacterium]NNF74292.1 hypothetical protein [Flavobacteriaceae bacterium]
MYTTLKYLHSYWAFMVLIVLIIAVVNAILSRNKNYSEKSFRIALFGLIVSHIQLILGLVLYFLTPMFDLWNTMGGGVMKDANARLYLVEHPLVNIIAIVLITIGYSKHKKKEASDKKYKTILVFYGLGLIFLLSRVPWDVWPSF